MTKSDRKPLRILVARELIKELYNFEGLYLETFSDNTTFKTILSYFFDGSSSELEFGKNQLS